MPYFPPRRRRFSNTDTSHKVNDGMSSDHKLSASSKYIYIYPVHACTKHKISRQLVCITTLESLGITSGLTFNDSAQPSCPHQTIQDTYDGRPPCVFLSLHLPPRFRIPPKGLFRCFVLDAACSRTVVSFQNADVHWNAPPPTKINTAGAPEKLRVRPVRPGMNAILFLFFSPLYP